MKASENVTVADLEHAYEAIAPLGADRRVVLGQLAKSIEYFVKTGSPAWAVSVLPRGFRLNTGQVEALTCFYYAFGTEEFGTREDRSYIDFRLLVSGPVPGPSSKSTEHSIGRK